MTFDLDQAILAAAGPMPPFWAAPTEPRVVTAWKDQATGLRCAMRPTGAFAGGWCAYLEVPEGVALEDLGAPADWVAHYEGLDGWDTGHAWLEEWTEEQVRAELAREAAVAHRLAQWPRWGCEALDRAMENSYFDSTGIFISKSKEDGFCLGGIKATRKPRGIVIEWWRWTPKNCKIHRAVTVEEAARGMVAAGASEPQPRMVKRLGEWASR